MLAAGMMEPAGASAAANAAMVAGNAMAIAAVPRMAKKKKVEEKKKGPSSLFILSDTNLLRRATRFLIEWAPFENCVVLAVETPLPNGDKTELAKQLVS
jgi:hypothetical protein